MSRQLVRLLWRPIKWTYNHYTASCRLETEPSHVATASFFRIVYTSDTRRDTPHLTAVSMLTVLAAGSSERLSTQQHTDLTLVGRLCKGYKGMLHQHTLLLACSSKPMVKCHIAAMPEAIDTAGEKC